MLPSIADFAFNARVLISTCGSSASMLSLSSA